MILVLYRATMIAITAAKSVYPEQAYGTPAAYPAKVTYPSTAYQPESYISLQ